MDKLAGLNKIISNCPLCEEHALHIIGDDTYKMQQCISCGYVSSDKFIIKDDKIEDNLEYQKLTDDMKSWIKMKDSRIWIPTIMTLPVGMLYPFDEDGNMKWGYAEMVDIPEEEQKNYPDGVGGYYKQKYDVDNKIVYDEFFKGMHDINTKMKEKAAALGLNDIKLPKLKKL